VRLRVQGVYRANWARHSVPHIMMLIVKIIKYSCRLCPEQRRREATNITLLNIRADSVLNSGGERLGEEAEDGRETESSLND
jgi:hypothetical protein